MVDDNQLYIGEDNVDFISVDGEIVKQIYFGSEKIYQFSKVVTFSPSSSLQTLYVPMGFHKLHIDCVASKGRDITQDSITSAGGNGGRVQCDLAVQGGETLYIMVGEIPATESPTYNASDIRIGGTELTDRIIVAGGGGGAAVAWHYGYRGRANGGAGGGTTGGAGPAGSGRVTAAGGGTQSSGGVGATYRFYGSATAGTGQLGLGGSSANAAAGHNYGSGGAGYYGGGGAVTGSFASEDGGEASAAGGGGGSSYTNADCSNVVHTQGYQDGAGYVTISFVS